MTRLRAPKVAVTAVPVFTSGELSELAKACQGRSFAARRDAAIIAEFTATGIRLSELAGICCHPGDPARSDLDLQAREIRIRGKGGTARTVKIGHQAARSLDRYLRAGSTATFRGVWPSVGTRACWMIPRWRPSPGRIARGPQAPGRQPAIPEPAPRAPAASGRPCRGFRSLLRRDSRSAPPPGATVPVRQARHGNTGRPCRRHESMPGQGHVSVVGALGVKAHHRADRTRSPKAHRPPGNHSRHPCGYRTRPLGPGANKPPKTLTAGLTASKSRKN